MGRSRLLSDFLELSRWSESWQEDSRNPLIILTAVRPVVIPCARVRDACSKGSRCAGRKAAGRQTL